jgi:hypothetical protein
MACPRGQHRARLARLWPQKFQAKVERLARPKMRARPVPVISSSSPTRLVTPTTQTWEDTPGETGAPRGRAYVIRWGSRLTIPTRIRARNLRPFGDSRKVAPSASVMETYLISAKVPQPSRVTRWRTTEGRAVQVRRAQIRRNSRHVALVPTSPRPRIGWTSTPRRRRNQRMNRWRMMQHPQPLAYPDTRPRRACHPWPYPKCKKTALTISNEVIDQIPYRKTEPFRFRQVPRSLASTAPRPCPQILLRAIAE